MNKTDSGKIKHYFREIRLLIPVSSKGVKKFLQDFRSSVEEYAENHPECSAEEIIEKFGSPEDVAYEYVSSVDAKEICRRITMNRSIKRVVGVIVIASVIVSGYRVWILHDAHQKALDEMPAYITEVIE